MPRTAVTGSNGPALTMLWEEARRLLVRQEAALDTLRTQAVAILSVGALIAGLFGAHVVPGGHSLGTELAIGAALILFAASTVLIVIVLAPHEWTFAHGLTDALNEIEKQEVVDAQDLSFSWAIDFECWRTTNQAKLDCLFTYFLLACVLTGAQVIAWGIAVL